MAQDNQALNTTVPWHAYLPVVIQSIAAFYIATLCIGIYFTHQGGHFLLMSIVFVLLYLLVILICIKRLISKLSVAALMLAIPIAPLLVLIMVVTMIPILENM